MMLFPLPGATLSYDAVVCLADAETDTAMIPIAGVFVRFISNTSFSQWPS